MTALIRGVCTGMCKMESGWHQVSVYFVCGLARHSWKHIFLGTPAYARLVSIATEQGLLKDIRKLSSSGQTYGLESYHSLLIRFAPKSVAFSTMMMRARCVSLACNVFPIWSEHIVEFVLDLTVRVPELFQCCIALYRTQLAALHHNENAGREQAVVARNCALRWKRKMLRAKKGAEVVCPVKSKPTYGM